MPSQKNQRKKNRRFEQKRNEISYEARFELVRKIAEKWGKELKVNRTGPTDGGAEQFTILLAFGDIPYIVLGAKGVGRSAIEADSNSAWNLLSFFQGFLSRSTMQTLRKKWAAAETEIGEIVQICRLIEDAVNTEQYNQLRTVPILDANPPEKSWARQLRLELRSLYAKKQLQSMAGKTTSQAATSTIFTQQAQLKTLKRKLSTVTSDADSGVPVTKKNKACQAVGNGYIETDWADEYDEDGLHFTYISPLSTSNSSSPSTLCLDDDDDVENACQASTSVTSKVEDSKPSLNISSTSTASVVNTSVRGVPELVSRGAVLHSEKDLTSPSRFEQDLIGVHFNPAAAPLPNLIRQYREKYLNEFKLLDDEIWKHYELNRQTEEVYQWKMEVRNILLAEFRPAFPYQAIELFAVGSTVNGCGSYNSDMDLCLCIPMGPENLYSSERMAAVKILRRLNTIIKGKPSLRKIVRRSEVIPAKVPIIKMTLHPPYEELDLDVNINNTAGIYNSHLIHYYSLIDPRFPAICLLIKHWAITNGIGDAATGSFNSYSLILLVLHYFQCGVQPAVLPNLQHVYPDVFGCTPPLGELKLFQTLQHLPPRPLNTQTVGELLVGFFHYYASFDFENVAISMRNACVFSRRELKLETLVFRVFIEEPFDRNNTARCVTKSYVMERIQRAFRQARDVFSKSPPSLQRIKVTV
ncbi:unnamed protein product [Cylicocyclus nassatus]|uniref:PAP-associated domain-containing protein n=2 Tax=Strongylidae TaxID=27830 RepID=A0AA36GH12_CYLNA|nr:unnamed protein product [Cylicocyclus nassatus]